MAEGSDGSSQTPSLVGDWVKVSGDPGTEIYPEHLRFAEGTFLGRRGQSQEGMMWWDAGIYRLEGPHGLVMSTANDELVHYDVQFDGDRLHIIDPDRRAVVYERA